MESYHSKYLYLKYVGRIYQGLIFAEHFKFLLKKLLEMQESLHGKKHFHIFLSEHSPIASAQYHFMNKSLQLFIRAFSVFANQSW